MPTIRFISLLVVTFLCSMFTQSMDTVHILSCTKQFPSNIEYKGNMIIFLVLRGGHFELYGRDIWPMTISLQCILLYLCVSGNLRCCKM